MLNWKQFYLFGQIQTSQTGGQQYSYTFPALSDLKYKIEPSIAFT